MRDAIEGQGEAGATHGSRRFRLRLATAAARLLVTAGLLTIVGFGDLAQGANIAIVGAIAGFWLQSGEEIAMDAIEQVRDHREKMEGPAASGGGGRREEITHQQTVEE